MNIIISTNTNDQEAPMYPLPKFLTSTMFNIKYNIADINNILFTKTCLFKLIKKYKYNSFKKIKIKLKTIILNETEESINSFP